MNVLIQKRNHLPKAMIPIWFLKVIIIGLVGHVDGFSLRVFRNGTITEAFKKYHDLAKQLDNYPVLDESDYSNREYEATVENIDIAAWKLKQQFELPDGWAHIGLRLAVGAHGK